MNHTPGRAKLHIEYHHALHKMFTATGSGESTLARIRAAIALATGETE